MKRGEPEDAAERMERELREEDEFDEVHRRSYLEFQDRREIARREHILLHEPNHFMYGYERDNLEAAMFRQVLAQKLPATHGKIYATSDFPVKMAQDQFRGNTFHLPFHNHHYQEKKKAYFRRKRAEEGLERKYKEYKYDGDGSDRLL